MPIFDDNIEPVDIERTYSDFGESATFLRLSIESSKSSKSSKSCESDELIESPSKDEMHDITKAQQQTLESQSQKSSWLFGNLQQSQFYKTLAALDGCEIEAKFNQLGMSGFLNFGEPGVCDFMTEDFSRAVSLNAYHQWKNNIENKDAEFIQYLRDGQYPHCPGYNEAVAKRDFGPQMLEASTYEEYSSQKSDTLRSGATFIINRINLGHYAKLRLGLKRTGNRFVMGSIGLMEKFAHAIIFTPSVEANGTIDDRFIFCMDPNAGIFKIENNETALNAFLDELDQVLYGQFQIRFAQISKVSFTDEQIEHFQVNGQSEDEQASYLSLYRMNRATSLDNFFDTEIKRLSQSSNHIHVNKVAVLKRARIHFHQEIKGKDTVEDINQLVDDILISVNDESVLKSNASSWATFWQEKPKSSNNLENITRILSAPDLRPSESKA